jgi:hypothetical protein
VSDTLFRAKAPGIMNLLMADFSLDVESAAAILGNLGHESGGFQFLQEKKPLIPGSAGGWGWAQWTGPRRREFEAYVARNGFDPASDTANYKWLWNELKGSERAAIPAVQHAVGLENKVRAFEMAFERAGIKHYESRNEWAERALNAYHSNPGGTIQIEDAPHNTGVVSPIPLPAGTAQQPAGNPIGGMVGLIQSHKDEARKHVMGLIGIFNAFYPDDMMVVQSRQPEPVKPEPVTQRPGVQLGIGGIVASLAAMASGHLGTPLGMGEAPSMWGNLAPLLSAGVALVSATGGGWTGLLAPVLKMVGGLASKATKP